MRNKCMHFLVYQSGSDSVYTHTNTRVWIMTSLCVSRRWLLWDPDGQESDGLPLQHHGEPNVLGQHCKLPRLGTHVSVNLRTCVVFLSDFFLFYFFSRLIIEVMRWCFRITQIELRALHPCVVCHRVLNMRCHRQSAATCKRKILFSSPQVAIGYSLSEMERESIFSVFGLHDDCDHICLIKQAGVSKLECP